MALLNTPTYSSALFTWVESERMLVTEFSTLGDELGRVYDDACDVGFTIRSERTGREVKFVETDNVQHDGEVLHSDFEPADLREREELNLKVRVFND